MVSDSARIDIIVKKSIEQSAEDVWRIFSDFGEISWVKGFARSETIGDGVGMLRRIFVTDDFIIDERLTSIDPDKKTLSYDFPAGFPFQLQDYNVVLTVEATSASSCELCWHASGVPEGMSEEKAKESIGAIYDNLFANLQDHLLSA